MNLNKKRMVLMLDPLQIEEIKKLAFEQDISYSEVVRGMINKFLMNPNKNT